MTKSATNAVPHDHALEHVTGRAIFIDDIPPRSDELHVGIVFSPVAAGTIRRLDVTAARSAAGVVAVYTADDLPGKRQFGPLLQDEPVLAHRDVRYVGQPVVVIAAESKAALQQARSLVQLEIDPTRPILEIAQARAAGRFIGPERRIHRGDAQKAIGAAPHRLSGTFVSGGQEHFYLESQCTIAYPRDRGNLLLYCSTQNPHEIQHVVAEALGLSMHKIVVVCPRMGGGFGGKETQAALPAIFAALVARTTGRAARIVYDRPTDMLATGKRHAMESDWEVGFDDSGRILGLQVHHYSLGGAAADLSLAVMERAMLHSANAYYLPDVDIRGVVCFTNHHPSTAFRGFGGPQGMIRIEAIIEAIAKTLGIDPLQVRTRNLYSPGRDTTPYGQLVERNHLAEIIGSLAHSSRYRVRRRAIAAANSGDLPEIRGIALTPVKFGISFTTRFLNQGGALVNVYTDGTVQVTTGGTEMGQGLNIKIAQLVANELGVPLSAVQVMETSTAVVPNTSPTAASASTDLNGAAAVNACRQIVERLKLHAATLFADQLQGLVLSPESVAIEDGEAYDRRAPAKKRIKFSDLCNSARMNQIDLSAHGFYATPGVDYNRETGKGRPFLYFTQGACCVEVAVNRFTGETRLCRVDILMDIGQSINEGIDRGQIIGGFVQGLGWLINECLVYDKHGRLLSDGPTTYKIPGIRDIPEQFYLSLFPNLDNVEVVGRSKAVGEPPFMLAIAAWAAVRDAMSAVSPEAADALRVPATSEEVLRCLSLARSLAAPVNA